MSSQKHPLQQDLGKAENDVKTLSNLRRDGKEEERKKLSDVTFINFRKEGISFCMDNKSSTLDSIWLYSANNKDKYEAYKGSMPQDIRWTETNADIVKRMGEPEGKRALLGTTPIFVDYKKLGIQIDFQSADYNRTDNPITSLCIYPPS
ncbi:hypothetical protein PROFUN_01220 [Planoprotostelium fungivorum]|uniref:Uncharacterized protein n=1 Tax=Planoprotostelium fungivorum TaxID=1890364 RepID=A0A2P6NZI1_9EUKA|nr:hypothetical protein PROFUN_01220 [Planoprotostelium fungivorum]